MFNNYIYDDDIIEDDDNWEFDDDVDDYCD